MGQNHSLPLPHKIPVPDIEQWRLFQQYGINWTESPRSKYVEYQLPQDWRIVNWTIIDTEPCYYIMDKNDNIFFSIKGVWTSHSKKLSLITETPHNFEIYKNQVTDRLTKVINVIDNLISVNNNN